MSQHVYVAAMSARSAVGLTPETAAAAVRAEVSRVREHPSLLDSQGEPLRLAFVHGLDPGMRAPLRILTLARSALVDLATRIAPVNPMSVAAFIALPEHRPGWWDGDELHTIKTLANEASHTAISLRFGAEALHGHSGAIDGLKRASQLIASGHEDVAIVGGADSYIDVATLEWLSERGQLRTGQARAGFFPGEAASFLLLVGERALRSMRQPPLAVMGGASTTQEAALINTDAVCLGRALTKAVREASRSGPLSPKPVNKVYGDLNGERYRTDEWGFVALDAHHEFDDPAAVVAPADLWGDVGASSAPLLATLAIESWRRGYSRGSRALIFAGAEAGTRGAFVLAQPPRS